MKIKNNQIEISEGDYKIIKEGVTKEILNGVLALVIETQMQFKHKRMLINKIEKLLPNYKPFKFYR